MWDPATYLRFGGERARPFFDLVARIGAQRPRVVVDLGCGPGNLTAVLAERWPGARVRGIDSSAEMIGKARAESYRVEFEVGDLRDWTPEVGKVRAEKRSDEAGPRRPSGVPASEASAVGTTPEAGKVRAEKRSDEAGPRRPSGVPASEASAVGTAPGAGVDVVVSNAALQWVPGHEGLLPRWVAGLPGGAWLAVQVPGNFDAPSHRVLRSLTVAAGLGDLARDAPVLDPAGYADLLADAGCEVDAWETTYLHRLPVVPGGDHPVLTWMEGTALRPVKAELDAASWDVFRDTLGKRLAEVYPARGTVVSFPFRRIFFVARKLGD